MKSALIAAVVAAIVSSGSAVAATTWISGRSIRPHSIPLNRLAHRPIGLRGPAGPMGAAGPTGATGAAGGFDPTRVVMVDGGLQTLAAHTTGIFSIMCPEKTAVVGGGAYTSGAYITTSYPVGISGDAGWAVGLDNETDAPITYRLDANCAS